MNNYAKRPNGITQHLFRRLELPKHLIKILGLRHIHLVNWCKSHGNLSLIYHVFILLLMHGFHSSYNLRAKHSHDTFAADSVVSIEYIMDEHWACLKMTTAQSWYFFYLNLEQSLMPLILYCFQSGNPTIIFYSWAHDSEPFSLLILKNSPKYSNSKAKFALMFFYHSALVQIDQKLQFMTRITYLGSNSHLMPRDVIHEE